MENVFYTAAGESSVSFESDFFSKYGSVGTVRKSYQRACFYPSRLWELPSSQLLPWARMFSERAFCSSRNIHIFDSKSLSQPEIRDLNKQVQKINEIIIMYNVIRVMYVYITPSEFLFSVWVKNTSSANRSTLSSISPWYIFLHTKNLWIILEQQNARIFFAEHPRSRRHSSCSRCLTLRAG